MNIWTKLDNGWGIRVADTEPRPGEAVKVTKKDGTASLETVGKVLRREGNSYVCTIVAKPRQAPPAVSRAPVATAPAATPRKSVNRRSGGCERCGTYLQPGQGELRFCMADTGCMKHHDDDGYHLYCLDEVACAEARKELVKAREEAKRLAGLVKAAIPDNWTINGSEPVEKIPDGAVSLVRAFFGSMSQVDRGWAYILGEDLFVERHEYDYGPIRCRVPGKAAEYQKALETALNGKTEVSGDGVTLKVA